ncbi:long-chain-fatty-acid--CoA ligase [Pararhodobacter marinus]|uniref:long-chain-fatty-acid--CoA ligase n=1 Tax=Pararhodobacter marinus TaxID=2184063 RepID=UPI003518EA11
MERLHHKIWPEDVPKDIAPIAHTLDDNLRRAAARHPDKAALVFYGRVTSYADLDDQVSRIAGYLQSRCQVLKGDRVGLYMQNAPQFVAGFYGIIRAGGVVVPINAMNLTEETDYIVENAGIRTLLAAQDRVAQLVPLVTSDILDHVIVATYADALPQPVPEGVPAVIAAPHQALPTGFVAWPDMLGAEAAPEAVAIAPTDLCVMPYTSGSTGKGKGCMHTHQTTLHAAACMFEWFGIGGDDVYLAAAPMFHVVGLQAGMNVPIATGGTIVILPRWDREIAAGLIRDFGVTAWPTVPTAIIDFLNRPGLKDDDLKTLRRIWGGGIAMPAAVAEKLHALTGLSFLEGYGMTETIAPATANPVHKPKTQCGGVPTLNTDVVIADAETQAPLPVGEIGEILIAGPQIMLGYWNNAEADAETFVMIEGKRFLRSGDLGRMDDEGYIYIVDRLKRMINASGYKVWPTEVESHLYRHPAIAEACVIGTNDPYRGETVKALVVLKPSASLDAKGLADWAHTEMAAYKVPRVLEIVGELPKSGSGKVLWRQLQDIENQRTKA